MPIKGLTDRGLAFPEIGQIRKGIKETKQRKDGSTYEIPKDLDYFRVEFDEQEQATANKFRKSYGAEPQEINIILPFDEIERCWDAWLEAYTAGRMVARSDGEKFTYLIDTANGEIKVKNGEPFTLYKEDESVGTDYQDKPIYCHPVGRLKVIVPELARAAYMTVMTTSVHDIANLSAQLQAFKQINGGVIKGIPLVLRRRPKKIGVPAKDGKRVRMEKWLLSIEADPAWVKAKLVEVKNLALPSNVFPLLPGEEEMEIEAEFVENEEDFEPPSSPDFDFQEGDKPPIQGKHQMSLEMAKAVKNSDGVLYGELPTDKLAHMANSLMKALKEQDLAPLDREEKQIKLDAIDTILKDRNNEGKASK
jgi:hypothetical protein